MALPMFRVAKTIMGGQNIGEDVQDSDAPAGGANGVRRFYVNLLFFGEHQPTDEPSEHGHQREANSDHYVGQARAKNRDNG